MPRVGELGGEVAVAREQQQAFAVVIEPADWIDVLPHAFQQLHNRPPAFRIFAGRDDVLGFVQENVARADIEPQAAAVHPDDIRRWVRLASEGAHDLAVHLDASLRNQLFRSATRGHARECEQFLQPFHYADCFRLRRYEDIRRLRRLRRLRGLRFPLFAQVETPALSVCPSTWPWTNVCTSRHLI
jgi:hypothetical protein